MDAAAASPPSCVEEAAAMFPNFTVGVFNQKRWPKAGDSDECWMLADLMAVHSVAPWLRLPNAPTYREFADNPDTSGPTGGTIDHSAKAIRGLWKDFGKLIDVMQNRPWDEFLAKLHAGHPASLSVLSGELPTRLQFDFTGTHRVAVFFNGKDIRLLNPLARAHSRSQVISAKDLRTAMRAHPDPRVNAIVMPSVEEAFKVHPLFSDAIEQAIEALGDDVEDGDNRVDFTTP